MADNLVLAMNIKNMAVTQYMDFNFNSFCEMPDGTILGANDSGIFKMEQCTGVETAEGSYMSSYFKTLQTDLGIPKAKRPRRVTIGGEAGDSLTVSLIDDEGTANAFTVTLESTAQKQTVGTVSTGAVSKGRYWAVKVANTDGCDYSVDSIELIMTGLGIKSPSGV